MSESILNENLIATFEHSLRQTRNAQNRLMVRLREVESEADRLRQEIEALDSSAEKTEAAIYSILDTMGSKRKPHDGGHGNNDDRNDGGRNDNNRGDSLRSDGLNLPSDIWREEQYNLERDDPRSSNNRQDNNSSNNYRDNSVAIFRNNNSPYRNVDNERGYRNNRDNRNNGNNNNNNNYGDNRSNNDRYNRNVPQVGQNIEPINQRFSHRTITQACTLLLNESGSPLHVNELYNHLVSGGFTFKGNNPTISIAVSLNRNRRFKKVAPGTFDLVMRDASQAAS